MYFFINQLDYGDLLEYIHLVKLYNLSQMANGQVEHLNKMVNVF
jgi:hypothetical protein